MTDSQVRLRTCPECRKDWDADKWRRWHWGRICGSCVRRGKRQNDPEFAERDRAHSRGWKARNRDRTRAYDAAHAHVPCPHCGGEKDRQSAMCMGCTDASDIVRRTLAEGMWAAGWSTREIGQVLGAPAWSAGPYRAHGWTLPRRYPVDENGRRVAA